MKGEAFEGWAHCLLGNSHGENELVSDKQLTFTTFLLLVLLVSCSDVMLNAYLLASCICVLVASTLYTFYWNRLFAAVIGLLLRIKFWNQGGSSIWIQIGG